MEAAALLPYPDKSGFDISPEAFETIRMVLKDRSGFNLECYKDKCIRRRINIRIRATLSPSAEDYCELLLEKEDELAHLLKVLTIHVSHFFRNPPTFAKLRKEIFPILMEQAQQEGRNPLTFWSVGCASGEEPFTIALILKEAFASELAQTKVSIIATDIDATTLESAKKAVYVEDRLEELPIEMKRRYFDFRENRYHLLPHVKEMVTFSQSDLNETEFFVESDLIICRNVLIYFERAHQAKILTGFADVLRKGGFLVLGKSESLVGDSRKRFKTICPVERIYQVI